MIADRVVKEVNARMSFLLDVGLDYLSLSRFRGNARRRRGAAHPPRQPDRQRARRRALRARRAVDWLASARQPPPDRHAHPSARDLGNTVLVVEHDEETIRVADHVVDIGPGAGEHGGEVVFSGTVKGLLQHEGAG